MIMPVARQVPINVFLYMVASPPMLPSSQGGELNHIDEWRSDQNAILTH